MQEYVVSIDRGGAFTDRVVIEDSGQVTTAKARSSPSGNFKIGFSSSVEAVAGQLDMDSSQPQTGSPCGHKHAR